MKIVVIAAARSRFSLLSYYLYTLNSNINTCGEFYTECVKKGNTKLEDITEQLFAKGDYITKIMGHNLLAEYTPNVFKLGDYNQIHLIERYDFFDQCCSMLVANALKIWHLRDNDNSRLKQHALIKNRNFTLSSGTIYGQGHNVARYLEMKKYLVSNDIPFTLHTYDNAIEYSEQQTSIIKNNISYDSIITNYHLKTQVNSLFDEYFCYKKAESDLDSFMLSLTKII